MKIDRLLAGAAVATLMASSAFAQAGSTPSSTMTTSGVSQTQGGTDPSAPPATTPGASQALNSALIITPSASSTIYEELKGSGQFTTLLAALDANGLTSVLQGAQPKITVIAPTDAAFAALPPGQLDAIKKDPAQLRALLTYHIITTQVTEAQVKGHAAGKVMTAAQKQVSIDGSATPIRINDANVLQAAVPASNGVIYVVDKVLTPSA